MDIVDLSWNEVMSNRSNNPLLPKSIRGLLVGKSGCGKTTLLLYFLLRPEWLDYNNLCVFGKSLFQPEYQILKKAFEETLPRECILGLFNMRDEIQDSNVSQTALVEEWAETIKNKSGIKCSFFFFFFFFETSRDVPYPRELSSENKNLMIFDNLLLEKQNEC